MSFLCHSGDNALNEMIFQYYIAKFKSPKDIKFHYRQENLIFYVIFMSLS